MILNSDLVRARRNDLGLSQRETARHLGVTSAVVARLEDGVNHRDLPLRTIAALADLLGCHPTDLFHQPPEPDDSADADDDAATLGALLAHLDRSVAADAVADALDWTLPRVRQAAADLDTRLRTCGMTLATTAVGDLKPVPAATAIAPDELQRAYREHHARRGLTHAEARMLVAVLADDIDPQRLTNPDTVTLARLRNAGLIEDSATRPAPAADTLHALGPTGGS